MIFYRYELIQYASLDQDGEYKNPSIPNPTLELRKFNLHSETSKGYWIGHGLPGKLMGNSKWISKTSKKRFAYPSKKEAMINFFKRTEKRISILKHQLSFCEAGLLIAKKTDNEFS